MSARRPVRSEWSLLRGPEWRDTPAPRVEAPELPPPSAGDVAGHDQAGPVVPAIAAVAPAEDWGPLTGGRIGERSPTARLSDADAELARELRAGGVPRGDVAARLGVSVATITRITRGETYRPVAAPPDRVVAVEPPAIVALAPPPAVWTEPDDAGPGWRDD